MPSPKGPTRWLRYLGLRKPRPEESVAWEIEHHIAELTDRLVDEGWSMEDARSEAERRFGDPAQYGPPMRRMEEGRMARELLTAWWDIVNESFVSVARTAKRYPAFTAGVVITLGLGIGANAVMYGIVDRLLLQPPAHVVDHERVQRVFVEWVNQRTGELVIESAISYPDYQDLKAHEGLRAAAYILANPFPIGSGESATQAPAMHVSAEFFPLLGVSPLRGRFFTTVESAPGSPLTAVVSEEYWRSVYGADHGVLGRAVEVNGLAHTIVGVAPAGFTGIGLSRVDFWLPLEATAAAMGRSLSSRASPQVGAVIRVRDGVSIEAAEAEANQLILNSHRAEPESDRRARVVRLAFASLISTQDLDTEDDFDRRGPEASTESRVAGWLFGVSVIVLLIACANVANLLLARGTRQRKEVAVRIALGASYGRVVGQMVVESVLLALAGGLLALVLAGWGGEIVRSTLLPGISFPGLGISRRLLGFTALAALVAGVAAGIGPALQGSRADITRGLGDASRGSSASRSELRGFLMIVQAAMSVVLLVGAGLFARSLGEARSHDFGLDVDRLLQARLYYRSSDIDERAMALHEGVRRVSALPGVRAAAARSGTFRDPPGSRPISVPGIDVIPQLPNGGPYSLHVSSGYFETAGVQIIRGRPFEAFDHADGAGVTVVSETMAGLLWPDDDALGGCLVIAPSQDCTSVVGIAEDVEHRFRGVPSMRYYLPLRAGRSVSHIYVRAEGDPESIRSEVATLLQSFSPEVWYADVQTLEGVLGPKTHAWTLGATMFTLFGLLALSLAAIGLYSVLAFDVAQRTRELGIRGALGATKSRLLLSVLYRGAGFAGLGVALGLTVAYFGAPYAGDLLFNVSTRDPWVLGGVAAALMLVSGVASLVPGMRATRADPIEALRAE